MKHVAAALLLALGNKPINESNMNEVLASVGVKPNPAAIALIVAATKGKSPDQIIKEGLGKLASTVAVAPAGGAAAAKEAPKDDKKPAAKQEKKKEEPKPEEDEDLGFGGLF